MKRRLLAALVLVGSALVTAAAAESGRDGLFIIFSGQSLDFRRDLESNLTLWHFEKAFYIPRLGQGLAPAVTFGKKSRGGTWDISYIRYARTIDFENGAHPAVYHALELNGRSFFLKKLFLHPYFLGGITIPFIHVDGGASFEGKSLDASYFGAGLNIGAGVLFEIGPSLIVNAGVLYRWLGFLYAYGEGKGRDINNLRIGYQGPEFGRILRADTLTFTIGLGLVL